MIYETVRKARHVLDFNNRYDIIVLWMKKI